MWRCIGVGWGGMDLKLPPIFFLVLQVLPLPSSSTLNDRGLQQQYLSTAVEQHTHYCHFEGGDRKKNKVKKNFGFLMKNNGMALL